MPRAIFAIVVACGSLTGLGCGGGAEEPKVGNVKEDPRLQRAAKDGTAPASAVARQQSAPKKVGGKATE